MDVVKPTNKPKKIVSMKFIVLIICIAGLLIAAYVSGNQVSVSKQDLIITRVQQGDLDITVDGYGKLASNKKQLLTAETTATVKEIILKPGARVTSDSVIALLENPQLKFQVENEKHELSQLTANLRQLKVNQQRELLTEQAVLAELSSRYESIQLKRIAQESLAKQGIISEITFKQTQLDEQQLKKRITILHERLEQLTTVHQEATNIQQQRIKQQTARLAIVSDQLKQLTVTAGFDGVLQRLPINIGQRLMAGDEIALIASTQELFAEVRVPQNQASKISINQKVIIDTRQGTVEGQVTRIDPIVSENTVQVDIALPKELPSHVRLAQNIDARIITKSLKNVRYIERPANVRSHSEHVLYQVDQSSNKAHRKTVKFGEQNNHHIELVSSVDTGEQFIISNLSNYQTDELALN